MELRRSFRSQLRLSLQNRDFILKRLLRTRLMTALKLGKTTIVSGFTKSTMALGPSLCIFRNLRMALDLLLDGAIGRLALKVHLLTKSGDENAANNISA